MNWSDAVLDYIRSHPFLASWPDAEVVLSEFDHSLHYPPTALPVWACHIAGGDGAQAVPLAAAFTLLNLASELLDDFQDQDTTAQWTHWRLDRVLTSTLSMIFLAHSCLARVEAGGDQKREILDGFAQVGLLASVGQNITATDTASLGSYWHHVQAKSGLVFAVGAWSGTRLATAEESALQAARDFGLALGTLIQIADDCRDFLAVPSAPSRNGLLFCLPVVFAREQSAHPSHQVLLDLLDKADGLSQHEWVQAVYRLVLEMGGLTRALATGKVYEQKALAALSAFDRERSAPLADYVLGILSTAES